MFVRRVGISVFMGALAIAGVVGCDAEELVEEAGGGDVDIEVGDLPEGFPKDDVPLPKGDIVSGTTLGGGNEQVWTVIFNVGNVEDVADDYRGQLEDAGFQVDDTFSSETAPGQEGAGELVSFTATTSDYLVNVFGGGASGEDVLTISVSRNLTEVP